MNCGIRKATSPFESAKSVLLEVAGFGGFASTFRVLDKDGYWVDIHGFQDCDSTADVIKCAQRP
ncbi:hypothetical protein [Streptomyces sp. NBC_01589]|uniref:hypothetical protein n=1 Tax=unclassified Streptomyces TaxID=2593676 RepID=UPI00386E07B8